MLPAGTLYDVNIETTPEVYEKTWRSTQRDVTDAEWVLIADLVPDYSGNGKMGRPPVHSKRNIVNAIMYVAATGCQWRALPSCYPHWNTVHRYHITWSRDGTWEKIADRLREAVRVAQGHDPEPSVGVVDARSVRGAATVTSSSRGYDAGKKISGRKCFGIVDSLGLLVAVTVLAASTSDNTGATGIEPAFSAWEGAVAPSADLVFRVFGLLRWRFGLTVCSRLGPGLTGCCGTNVARRRNRSRASRASGRFV